MTQYYPYIGAILGFGAMMLFFVAVSGAVGSRQRVKKIQDRMGEGASRDSGGFLSGPLGGLAGRLGRRVTPKDENELSSASLDMVRAGYTGRNALSTFWGVKVTLAVSGVFLALAVKLFGGVEVPPSMLALMIVFPAVIGLYVPNLWLRMRISSRRNEVVCALPDALDLLVVCVESGMGLDQALHRVSAEIKLSSSVLAQELNTVILELRAGKARSDALKNLSRRVGVEDVNSLVTLIIQADSFGTSIAQTLRVYSDAMRTTRYQRAEELAAKLPVKLLFPLVLFILPALLVVIAAPAGIRLMNVFTQLSQ